MFSNVFSFFRERLPHFWLGIITGGILAAGLLLLWSGDFFAFARLQLSDVFFVPEDTSDNIVIVALDDASQAEYGRAPAEWSREHYADLIAELNQAEARVIAFDILFAESTDGDETLAEAIASARTSEVRTRFVMAAAGVQSVVENGHTDRIQRFTNLLSPVSDLGESVDYLGITNAYTDIDGAMRRQPSRVEVDEETYLSFPVATYLAYLRIPSSAVPMLVTVEQDTLILPERRLSIDSNGFWRPYFFGPPASLSDSVFPVVSFHDVAAGRVSPDLFRDKIVLVGVMRSTGMTDLYQIPSAQNNQRAAGVEIYAHAIETLIQDMPVTEQYAWPQALAIVALTLIASVIYVHQRWYWMLLTAGVLVGVWILFAFVVFTTQLKLIDLLYPILALTIPAPIQLGMQITTEFNRRLRAEALLDSVVALSRQQMALDRIVPRIAEDLQRALGTERVEIWLQNTETESKELRLAWPTASNHTTSDCLAVMQRARTQQDVVTEKQCAAVPVKWQGRLLAIFAATSPHGIKSKALQTVETLAHQIAPGLENALLYTELSRQKALLEALIGQSPAGIMVLDDKLCLRKGNQVLENMFGISLKDRAGALLVDVLAASGVIEETRTSVAENLRAKHAFRKEIQSSGHTFIFDAAPLAAGWVVIVNDVSALAELSALKTRMIRMASHDLKNPLQSVLGYGYILLNEKSGLDEPHVSRVQALMRGAHRMKEIIEGILDLEHLRSSSIEHTPLDLTGIVDEVIQYHQPDMNKRQQEFTATIAADLPPVRGHARHLTQAVTNLLGNAVKYTPDKGRIMLRLYQHDSRSLRLEIEDTGYGISEQAQAQLFQEFYRAQTAGTENIPGTGLGLSLVKWVIESHQGRVWVQSTEGVGSTFFVELPCIDDTKST